MAGLPRQYRVGRVKRRDPQPRLREQGPSARQLGSTGPCHRRRPVGIARAPNAMARSSVAERSAARRARPRRCAGDRRAGAATRCVYRPCHADAGWLPRGRPAPPTPPRAAQAGCAAQDAPYRDPAGRRDFPVGVQRAQRRQGQAQDGLQFISFIQTMRVDWSFARSSTRAWPPWHGPGVRRRPG